MAAGLMLARLLPTLQVLPAGIPFSPRSLISSLETPADLLALAGRRFWAWAPLPVRRSILPSRTSPLNRSRLRHGPCRFWPLAASRSGFDSEAHR